MWLRCFALSATIGVHPRFTHRPAFQRLITGRIDHNPFVRTVVLVLSATVLVLERIVTTERTFDHDRRLSEDRIEYEYSHCPNFLWLALHGCVAPLGLEDFFTLRFRWLTHTGKGCGSPPGLSRAETGRFLSPLRGFGMVCGLQGPRVVTRGYLLWQLRS